MNLSLSIHILFSKIRSPVNCSLVWNTRYKKQETLLFVGSVQQLTLACKQFSDKRSKQVKQGNNSYKMKKKIIIKKINK